jgi:hypothetical protein
LVRVFKINEIVIFNSNNPKVTEVKGLKGYICGEVFDENQQKYLYAVTELQTEIVYSCYSYELIPTYEFYHEEI